VCAARTGLTDYYRRRWTFYTLLIWTGVLLGLVIFFVPETYHKVLLKRKAQQKRKETGDDRWFAPIEKVKRTIVGTLIRSCKVPIQLVVLEPMCLLLNIYAAILLGIVYLFFGAFPLVFERNHGFQLYQVGLSFLGLGIGMVLGVLTDPFWHKNYLKLVRRLEEKTGDPDVKPEPEFRLPTAMFGGVLVPIGLFWFGWTTYSSVHWVVPIIGSAVFGIGLFLAFTGILTFLVDAYPNYAASAVASNCLVRLVFAAAFPLFGTQSECGLKSIRGERG
jgi:MFS family permease